MKLSKPREGALPLPANVKRYYDKKTDRYHFWFLPPRKYRELGVLENKHIGHTRKTAVRHAARLNKILDDYKEQYDFRPSRKITFTNALHLWLRSDEFIAYADTTKHYYKTTAARMCKRFGDMPVYKLTRKYVLKEYNSEWVPEGWPYAQAFKATGTRIFDNLHKSGVHVVNPFRLLPTTRKDKRKPVKVGQWQHQQIIKLLDTAYSDPKTYNCGFIFHMAYELAQNARALTLLEWDDIDFDTCTATILLDRNKDRTVTVPLSDDLMFMLNEQRKVWGWQRLVAPNPISRRGTVTAFSHLRLSDCFADIRKKAGLPDNLKLRDIHLTGIKPMLDAGVDTMQILTVIGRDRLSLLQKYVDDNISHSPKAVDALERRMAHIKQKE